MKNRIWTNQNDRNEFGVSMIPVRNPFTAACLLCCIILTSCDNPERDFQKAEQANTETAYSDFIMRHPDSPHVAQAQADLEKVAYEATKRAASSEAFEKFLSLFPKSPLVKQAQVDFEIAEYERARKSDTVAAYEAYLTRFPAGEHLSAAKVELENAEFTDAQKKTSIPIWRAYLKKYPQSVRSDTATSNLCVLSFNNADSQNTTNVLDAFLTEFPSSQFTQEASEKLASLIWDQVRATNSVSGYEAFFKRFSSTSVADRAAHELVHKAVYGKLPDGPSENVTDKVRVMVRNGSLNTPVNDVNFGDLLNGTLRLTISRAIVKVRYLNFGGEGGGADMTDTIKQFQTGNTLHTTMSGGGGDDGTKFTVYYNYGDGIDRSTESAKDGSLTINPPTKLHVEYTIGGLDNCKTTDYGHNLEINGVASDNPKPFLGRWGGMKGDITIDGLTIEENGGKPSVTMSGAEVSGVTLECGNLTFNWTWIASGWEFRTTLTPTVQGMAASVFSVRAGRDFYGTLTKQ